MLFKTNEICLKNSVSLWKFIVWFVILITSALGFFQSDWVQLVNKEGSVRPNSTHILDLQLYRPTSNSFFLSDNALLKEDSVNPYSFYLLFCKAIKSITQHLSIRNGINVLAFEVQCIIVTHHISPYGDLHFKVYGPLMWLYPGSTGNIIIAY